MKSIFLACSILAISSVFAEASAQSSCSLKQDTYSKSDNFYYNYSFITHLSETQFNSMMTNVDFSTFIEELPVSADYQSVENYFRQLNQDSNLQISEQDNDSIAETYTSETDVEAYKACLSSQRQMLYAIPHKITQETVIVRVAWIPSGVTTLKKLYLSGIVGGTYLGDLKDIPVPSTNGSVDLTFTRKQNSEFNVTVNGKLGADSFIDPKSHAKSEYALSTVYASDSTSVPWVKQIKPTTDIKSRKSSDPDLLIDGVSATYVTYGEHAPQDVTRPFSFSTMPNYKVTKDAVGVGQHRIAGACDYRAEPTSAKDLTITDQTISGVEVAHFPAGCGGSQEAIIQWKEFLTTFQEVNQPAELVGKSQK